MTLPPSFPPPARPDLADRLLAAVAERDQPMAERLVQQWVHRRGLVALDADGVEGDMQAGEAAPGGGEDVVENIAGAAGDDDDDDDDTKAGASEGCRSAEAVVLLLLLSALLLALDGAGAGAGGAATRMGG